jgi:hypothetical protein
MKEREGPPGWFLVIVVLAVVAGVGLAFWVFGALTA